jgi:hypothetical protein
MKNPISEIVDKYKPYIFIKINDAIMHPKVAISLITALSKAQVLIIGCDFWRFVQLEDEIGLMELAGATFSFDNYRDLDHNEIVQKVISYLRNQFPEDADMVSLLIMDEEVNRLLQKP